MEPNKNIYQVLGQLIDAGYGPEVAMGLLVVAVLVVISGYGGVKFFQQKRSNIKVNGEYIELLDSIHAAFGFASNKVTGEPARKGWVRKDIEEIQKVLEKTSEKVDDVDERVVRVEKKFERFETNWPYFKQK